MRLAAGLTGPRATRAARLAGVTRRTLRTWENQGLPSTQPAVRRVQEYVVLLALVGREPWDCTGRYRPSKAETRWLRADERRYEVTYG